MSTTQLFGPDSTTDQVLDGLDLTGTLALVTGASAGLGLETVRALASRGASVVAAARDSGKAEKALGAAGVEVGGPVRIEEVDLADLASIRACTDRISAETDRLNLLIANAGVMACPEGRTADGFETQFGVNHLGHFVLVNRLVPLLVAGAPSRVVCLSSAGHRLADVDLEDPNFASTPYNAFLAYSRSKTANVLFAVELDRRWRGKGLRTCAVHPGSVDTELDRHLDDDAKALLVAHRRHGKSIPAGAATSVWAAVVAPAEAIGGRYAEDCAVAEVSDEELTATGGMSGVRSYAVDPARARALWARSEELVGESFA